MPLSAAIRRLDVDLGAPLLLPVIKPGLEEDVRQKRIVHLQQDACRDDRPIFLVQLDSQRVEVFLLALVVLVEAYPEGAVAGKNTR